MRMLRPRIWPDGVVLVVEGYNRAALHALRSSLSARLTVPRVADQAPAWTSYALAYVLDREELPTVAPYPRASTT